MIGFHCPCPVSSGRIPPSCWPSSVVLELARRELKAGSRNWFNRAWTAASLLGALFLIGQYAAWRQLQPGRFLYLHQSEQFVFLCAYGNSCRSPDRRHGCAVVCGSCRPYACGWDPASAPPSKSARCSGIFWPWFWIYLVVLFFVLGVMRDVGSKAATMATSVWQGGGSPYAIGSKKFGMWLFIISDALTFSALADGLYLSAHRHARTGRPRFTSRPALSFPRS